MRLPRATHGGELAIGGLSLACYVLNDGMRTVVDLDPKRAWQKFRISLERSYPRKHTNYNLDFDEED